MHAFDFAAASTVRDALGRAADGTAYLAGGTTLVDLMKLDVMTPQHVVDINALPLRGIWPGPLVLRIGALERMSAVAVNWHVATRYPVITQALLASASPQIRNMASIGGNLLQRTRCDYFRDVTSPCNKREPGSGCPAQTGENRTHAILGTSESCVATHASDLAVALVALDASVVLVGRSGARVVRLVDFYLLPGDTPHLENVLAPGELITEIRVPALAWARRSTYLKIRDRQAYEFALASAAVALDLRGSFVRDARVAVGGAGTRPWRLPAVEAALRGRRAVPEQFEAAARLAVADARPLARNGFKVTLVQRTIVRALTGLVGTR
jgi:xanthine dehydrogenase YagS FAD-binding subunit